MKPSVFAQMFYYTFHVLEACQKIGQVSSVLTPKCFLLENHLIICYCHHMSSTRPTKIKEQKYFLELNLLSVAIKLIISQMGFKAELNQIILIQQQQCHLSCLILSPMGAQVDTDTMTPCRILSNMLSEDGDYPINAPQQSSVA